LEGKENLAGQYFTVEFSFLFFGKGERENIDFSQEIM
jgi:hypothetical protein